MQCLVKQSERSYQLVMMNQLCGLFAFALLTLLASGAKEENKKCNIDKLDDDLGKLLYLGMRVLPETTQQLKTHCKYVLVGSIGGGKKYFQFIFF